MPDTFNSADGKVQAYKSTDQAVRNSSISNNAIVISAILCLGGLTLVVVSTLITSKLLQKSAEITVSEDSAQQAAESPVVTEFKEGYSMILPLGFSGQNRRETEAGYIIYTVSGDNGCKLSFALINDDTLGRFASPPKTYKDSLIQRIPELSTDIEGEVAPERISINGLPSVLFRFYEKETFRGVVFTYYMVSMDRGKKLVLKIAGKHGNYSDQDLNINMPDQWYDAMLTLKRTGRAR